MDEKYNPPWDCSHFRHQPQVQRSPVHFHLFTGSHFPFTFNNVLVWLTELRRALYTYNDSFIIIKQYQSELSKERDIGQCLGWSPRQSFYWSLPVDSGYLQVHRCMTIHRVLPTQEAPLSFGAHNRYWDVFT